MRNKNKPVDRRRQQRFDVRNSAFVLLGPDSTKLGALIDISMGGLSFNHMARKPPSNELYELDIFLIDQDFYLQQVPFNIVWDCPTEENPLSSITMRRCGVQFGQMTHTQMSQLEYFIQAHCKTKPVDDYSAVKDLSQNQQSLYL